MLIKFEKLKCLNGLQDFLHDYVGYYFENLTVFFFFFLDVPVYAILRLTLIWSLALSHYSYNYYLLLFIT